jgi:hypothetical protein
MADLKETVTITRELSGVRRDLANFVLMLAERGYVKRMPNLTDQKLVELTADFWDSQHGED